MEKSTVPVGVRGMLKWIDKGMLDFEHPVQRRSGIWNSLSKSLLVHSILGNYPVPPVYLIKTKEGDGVHYSALDGKQRMTSLKEFVEGGFALNSSTPDVVIDGECHEIAGLFFEELDDELQDLVFGFRFTVYCLENATEEEVFESFARLNNGVALSPTAKCRSEMTGAMAGWTGDICETGFYTGSASFTLAQLRSDADLCTLLQVMLLLDARNEGYDYKSISTSDIRLYCRHIKGGYGQEKMDAIERIFGYLTEAFPEKEKCLKKSNIPMVGGTGSDLP